MTTNDKALDEEYGHLHPHAFHLQLPKHHKTDGGIPYATIDAHRKARAIIKLCNGLVLKEEFFVNDAPTSAEDTEVDDENGVDDDNGPTSLYQLSQQAQRLYSQLSKFSGLHYDGGISQMERCEMFIKVMNLLCATVEIVENKDEIEEGVSAMAIDDDNNDEKLSKRKVIIHYDNVGYILNGKDTAAAATLQQNKLESTEEALAHPFALPSPTRQSLLNVAIELIGGKKNTLRGVSNSAIMLDEDDMKTRQRLIISYQALLRMLLRTSPYLDEHKLDVPPKEANGIRSSILKKSVTVIRGCRRFFDQGDEDDTTARQLWSSLRSDVQYHTHSNSAFRALILLYLFHPTKCSLSYYKEVVPIWMDCWRNIDRCPEWDFLWMVMFSRARKYLPADDSIWTTLHAHLLSSCAIWLQVPVGGVSSDKLFPNARGGGSRKFPARLKVFLGMNGRYEEGMDFVSRLVKLLIFCCGTGNVDDEGISSGTSSLLRFLSYITPYFNPSNSGAWTFPVGAFLHYLSYELCARVGKSCGLKVLQRDHTNIAEKLIDEELYLKKIDLHSAEIVALLDIMLPLCQQALYSKNATVSHAGETALLYLSQIDPARSTPPLIDFSLQALDISSVNQTHQTPAALSTLSRLLQPSLRVKSSIFLSRLPDLLRLTLAGVDGNDQNKSLRTLVLYRNLVMWIPVGGTIALPSISDDNSVVDKDGNDGTLLIGNKLMDVRYGIVETDEYKDALATVSQSSIFAQHQLGMAIDEDDSALMEEAMMAMSEWSLMFLDRIYELMRAAGEQEKLGKGGTGVGMRSGMQDIAMTKNFSRIQYETLLYFFAGMDDNTFDTALRSVVRFFDEETLPFAVKDASLLCRAICSTRFATDENSSAEDVVDRSPGLDALVPILTEDLEHKSSKSAIYRIRCLAGAVRYAGSTVLKHSDTLTSVISFALSKTEDRMLFKTGCKLLRHLLSSQCEEYPIAQCYHPCMAGKDEVLGKSALLQGKNIFWHIPSAQQLDFTVSLLSQFTLPRWTELGKPTSDDKAGVNLQQWRQTLRVLRYTLRGCSGILLDEDPNTILSYSQDVFSPKEMAISKLILSCSDTSKQVLFGLRKRLCSNLMDIMCLIAKDTSDCESTTNADESSRQYKKNEVGSLSSDAKILNEVIELSELLIARRGAKYQSSNGKTIYRGQKEILTDYTLADEANIISLQLSRCNNEVNTGLNRSVYKDGEDAGKTVSRALLVNRLHLCLADMTANASSEVPRRLRKLRGGGPNAKVPPSLFSLDITLETLQENLSSQSAASSDTSLEIYEALVDGLFALSCHPNINVRAGSLSIVDFALSRFGWVVKHNDRPKRLLDAISLNDEGQKGVHGIPSCSSLVNQVNSQGKRSRLGEVVKSTIKIVNLPKVLKEFHCNEARRFELVKMLCGTQQLLQLVPPEEVAKIVHYINEIFLSYRSKLCSIPRNNRCEQATHEACLSYLLGILQERGSTDSSEVTKKTEGEEEEEDAIAMHWRDRLVAAWFVLKFIDEMDLMMGDPKIVDQVWSICFTIIEDEVGQPLQRVSLGLLGRLVSLALVDMSQTTSNTDMKHPDLSLLRTSFMKESFCFAFVNALVYDHREDTSVGGGHSAQWSRGIEEIIRDSSLNVARRTLFPFNRVSQKSVTFKLSHSQLIETILLALGHNNAKAASKILLEYARELVASPPSEDQRNQQVTSAEILSGVSRALIQYSSSDEERTEIWNTLLLPFLDEAVVKMPTNVLGAYYDACRYAIHHFPPGYYFPLLTWSVLKVKKSLWQHEVNEKVEESSMDDRFALQGKWLLMFQAVIVELDYEDDVGATTKPPFYIDLLDETKPDSATSSTAELELGKSWKYVNDNLTPCLLNAIGHPYNKCRDHIAACLFRMCYCHRNFINTYTALGDVNSSTSDDDDPGISIIKQLVSIRDSDKYSFKEKNRALGTARKFIAFCVHFGDAKHEYSDFIIPLLPLAFQSLQTIEGEASAEDRGGIEADLVKGYRYAIADISSNCVVNYGVSQDMTRALDVVKEMSTHDYWQIRQASAHFLRNFQGAHKFLFNKEQSEIAQSIAIALLSDDRREVSAAATSTLTGILTMLSEAALEDLVTKYVIIANKSLKKKKRKKDTTRELSTEESELLATKEKARATKQQRSVFVLCAIVMGSPYKIPPYIPVALAALSKHSFEQRASLSVREVVKMVCSEFKKTHTDNWEQHRAQFTQEQIEALEDVVSTPHYYA